MMVMTSYVSLGASKRMDWILGNPKTSKLLLLLLLLLLLVLESARKGSNGAHLDSTV